MPVTIQGRLSRLEDRARGRFMAKPGERCICKRSPYYHFTVHGATPAEIQAALPHNREYCPKCGGRCPEVVIDKDDLEA